MKKYIKPEIEICVLDVASNLLAASFGEGDNSSDNPGMDGINALSKGHTFSVWGEDEDEE